jgi:phosphoglycerate dehydrogenase-like enzyme
MIRVLLTRAFFAEDLAFLQAGLRPDVELIVPPAFTPEALAEAVGEADVLLGDNITRELLARGTRLRLIQVPWTGVDRLDFALLRDFNVPVCNSHSNALPVAEMAVSLMLAITKKIPLHDARLRQGNWMRPTRGEPDSHVPPTLVSGRTAGFIGFGAIARLIAELLGGFHMRFIATDARTGETPAPLDAVYPPDAVTEVAAQSDILFVTVPLTPATRGLVNADIFAVMQPSAYLINTSRGEVVDEAALYAALSTRQIAGAGIDTWYQYPKAGEAATLPSARFPFHELDNLVLSPHRAGFAEGLLPHLQDVIDNLNRLAAGDAPRNQVDVTAGF